MGILTTVIILTSLLSACAMTERRLTVISTPAQSEVRRIVVDEGDILLCDKEVCKVIRR